MRRLRQAIMGWFRGIVKMIRAVLDLLDIPLEQP